MTHCGKFRTGPITRRDMLARGAAGLPAHSAHAAVRERVRARSIKGITGSMASDSNTTPPKPAV